MASVKLSSAGSSGTAKQPWLYCDHCTDIKFKEQTDFSRHLRIRHCTREGGSFVCRYGANGVCSSLPVEGVSDKDYEDHVLKHHVYQAVSKPRKKSENAASYDTKSALPRLPSRPPSQHNKELWNIFMSSQNLPAVLNDPNRGKQRDFFTKLWGDDFVESAYIGKPEHLPEVSPASFEPYLRKISRRYKRHVKISSSLPNSPAAGDLLHQFPNLRLSMSSPDCACSICVRDPALKILLDKSQFDIGTIPRIFMQPNFDLRLLDTFNAVYPPNKPVPDDDFENPPRSPSQPKPQSTAKQLQEKLTHYLDLVEVQIAHQVAQKSDAFFQAMSSHDTLMDQLSKTCTTVTTLRGKIQNIDSVLVKDSLKILRLAQMKQNYVRVFDKLKLMATVHQTQPMLQLLLSIPDYVAALDLISTTQEILVQELAGVHSFRHLSSQLSEMQRLIDKMLSAEFERYATADLNRPLGDDIEVLEGDKLVSIVYGMLRQKHFNFIDKYKEEAFTTIKAVVKQLVIEELAASDSGEGDVRLTGTGEQLQVLSLPQWCQLLEKATTTLLKLIHHVKTVHDVMREAADKSAGQFKENHLDEDSARESCNADVHVCDPSETLLTLEERAIVVSRLSELLCSVCDYAHDRCAQLLTAQSKESWLDRATAAQVCDLAKVVEDFVKNCELICGRSSSALRSAFKVQASKFVQKFHQDRKDKLTLILDSEVWKQAEVPSEFQTLADKLNNNGKMSLSRTELEGSLKRSDADIRPTMPANVLMIGDEKYSVVGTVLLLLKMIAEYCQCAEELTVMAPNLLRYLIELLQLFNSRSCQLVLGAGALHSVGLNTITSTNLALTSRALQLVLVALDAAKRQLLPLVTEPQRVETHLENLERDLRSHGREIENKLLALIGGLLTNQISQWEAKPPVPSNSFRNVSKHLRKLHEAISVVLPEKQVQHFYRNIHKMFKQRLKDQLIKMNVLNNGGPQHGVVISELTFYLETLRTLKVMPVDELMMGTMEDIWIR